MKKSVTKIIISGVIVFCCVIFFNKVILADTSLSQKLKGKILLQVEENGEAWYVNPVNLEKYYLGRPHDAFDIMQSLGIGITNEDLWKIPVASFGLDEQDEDNDGVSNALEVSFGTDIFKKDTDGDGYDDKKEILNGHNPKGTGVINIDKDIVKRLSGFIVLQVESNGEAWYINTDDLKRYYLGRPKDAFAVMRDLGLGINNNNLAQIIEHNSDSKYSSEYIVKNNTTVIADNKRKYIDPENKYSFEYLSDWKIQKSSENENFFYITDSKKDFFLEARAIIAFTYVKDDDLDLNNFKIASIKAEESHETNINEHNALEQIFKQEFVNRKTTVIENEGEFIQVSLILRNDKDIYNNIYSELIHSVKFLK